MMKRNILVTGVGAIIGHGILKSLQKRDLNLIGIDIYNNCIGKYFCDNFEQAPLTSDPTYNDWILSVCKKHNVDLIIPGIEPDVFQFSSHRSLFTSSGIKIALNSDTLINLSKDKWQMFKAQENAGDPSVIPTKLGGLFTDIEAAFGLPFIIKPRSGSASKGFVKIENQKQFEKYGSSLSSSYIAQKLIGTPEDEYTVGIFGDGAGQFISIICMRRILSKDGSTAKAWIVQDTSLFEVVKRLTNIFKPLGPTNMQFIRDEGMWKLLEINPRISSSTSLRTGFGYNESAMTVEYFLEGRLPNQPKIRQGHAIRYIEDHFVFEGE